MEKYIVFVQTIDDSFDFVYCPFPARTKYIDDLNEEVAIYADDGTNIGYLEIYRNSSNFCIATKFYPSNNTYAVKGCPKNPDAYTIVK